MNYLRIETEDVCNGAGLRVTIWCSSCSHKCNGCFNKESWNSDSGELFDHKAKEKLFLELSKDYISGITFSGGDPLHENNIYPILSLTQEIKEKFPSKTIWLYTGYSFDDLKEKYQIYRFAFNPNNEWIIRWNIISLCDVLIDGEYINEQRDVTLKWRGSKNQRVINILETLKQNKVILYCD